MVSPAGGLGSSMRGSERSPTGAPSPQPGPPSPSLALTTQSTPRSFWKQTLPGFEEEGATTSSQAHFPSSTEGPDAHEEPPSHCVLILALACHHLHLRSLSHPAPWCRGPETPDLVGNVALLLPAAHPPSPRARTQASPGTGPSTEEPQRVEKQGHRAQIPPRPSVLCGLGQVSVYMLGTLIISIS